MFSKLAAYIDAHLEAAREKRRREQARADMESRRAAGVLVRLRDTESGEVLHEESVSFGRGNQATIQFGEARTDVTVEVAER